jgi:hypothetical protein
MSVLHPSSIRPFLIFRPRHHVFPNVSFSKHKTRTLCEIVRTMLDGDNEDGGVVPAAEHVHTTLTTLMDGPTSTPTTTNQDQGEATVEGEVASRWEPPRRVLVDHPASRIIGDRNECTTRSRVRNNSHFAQAAFCFHL